MTVIKGQASSKKKVVIGKIKHIDHPETELASPVGHHFGDDTLDTTYEDEASHSTPIDAPPVAAPQIDHAAIEAEVAEIKAREMAALQEELDTFRRKTLDDIESEKQQLFEDAQKNGFDAGSKDAEDKLAHQSKDVLDALNDIAKVKNDMVDAAKPELLKLSVKIASHIIRGELSINQSVTQNIVDDAIKRTTEKDNVTIRLNPVDAEWLRSQKDWLQNHMKDIKTLQLKDDSNVQQGGCVIDTALGYVDASIQTKLASVEKALLLSHQDEQLEAPAAPHAELDMAPPVAEPSSHDTLSPAPPAAPEAPLQGMGMTPPPPAAPPATDTATDSDMADFDDLAPDVDFDNF